MEAGSAEPTVLPPDVDAPFTHVWSGEPGIDLLGRGSELVRAALEAGNLAYYYRFGNSFEGYADAVGAPFDFDSSEIWDHQVHPGSDSNEPPRVTYRYHIANLIESPTEITADICEETVGAESYISPGGWPSGFEWTVTLRNAGETSGLPGIPDTDPDGHDPRSRRVPDWNVFGSWEIVQMRTGGRDRVNAHPRCTDWWLERYPSSELIDGFVYPTEGVGVPGGPVAQQYPEWIGPASPQ